MQGGLKDCMPAAFLGLNCDDTGQRMGRSCPVHAGRFALPAERPALHLEGSSRIVPAFNVSLDAYGVKWGHHACKLAIEEALLDQSAVHASSSGSWWQSLS